MKKRKKKNYLNIYGWKDENIYSNLAYLILETLDIKWQFLTFSYYHYEFLSISVEMFCRFLTDGSSQVKCISLLIITLHLIQWGKISNIQPELFDNNIRHAFFFHI